MATNKRVDVTLGFTADTNKVKKQLQDLQKQLSSLITSPTKNPIGISKEIQEASVAAATLKTQLQKATNVNTGALDLGKFTRSLKESGYKLEDYQKALRSLGMEGNKAFASLAKSIMYAEAPLKKTNAMIDRLAKSLESVVSWQISSSILNLFTGTLQDAYNYAKSLDASLNSIRIVTGKTTEQMARFAEEANKAARSLSTTTTAYTDASLIFFQQGLPEAEVKSRTDAVIKMSNVTGEAAADVSSYMTAIWNNFAKGNKDLKSFGDIITALGAATASSTKEIAGGLEKFSAVANQIGLSYEYATTALATVVARTRQSEDIVGTSFKTIFARLQSLKLGETLDDDTSLTKYSKALAAVGVSIKDTFGELKSMDDILDDLGGKWDTLSRAQQTALAQTVAGQRQYNQFIALMDSWNTDFQKNLAIANNSEGALQEQADIYAEGWEAARKRVTSAWQGLYDELIDEKFFISLQKGLANLIDLTKNFVKGLGGIEGVLVSFSSILTNVFAKQGASAINGFLENMFKLSSKGKDEMSSLRKNAVELLKDTTNYGSIYGNYQQSVLEAYNKQSDAQKTLIDNADRMTDQQKMIAQLLLDQHEQLVANVEESAKYSKEAEINANATKTIAIRKVKDSNVKGYLSEKTQNTATKEVAQAFFDKAVPTQENFQSVVKSYKESFEELKKSIAQTGKTYKDYFGTKGVKIFENFEKAINKPNLTIKGLEKAYDKLWDSIDDLDTEAFKERLRILRPDVAQYQTLEEYFNKIKEIYTKGYQNINSVNQQQVDTDALVTLQKMESEALKSFGTLEKAFGQKGAQIFNDLKDAITNGKLSVGSYNQEIAKLIQELEQFKKSSNAVKGTTKEQREAFIEAEQSASEYGSGLAELLAIIAKLEQGNQNVKTFFDNLKKAGMSTGQVIMTVTSSVTALMSAYKAFNSIFEVSQQLAEGQIDAFEGLSQIFTSLSFVLPNVFNNLKKVFNTLKLGGASTLKASLITGGYVVVILALIKGVEYLIKLYQKFKANSPEGQLKSAKERASELATELENTTAKAEEVKNTFDTYTEIKKNLDECTKGTKEWYEALEKANNNALELIKQFPQLLTMTNELGESAVTFNAETGNTEVAEWALGKIAADAQRQNAIAQFTSIQANKDVSLKQLNLDKQILIKDNKLLKGLSEIQINSILNEFSQSKYNSKDKDLLKEDISKKLGAMLGADASKISNSFSKEIDDLADKILKGLINFNDRLEDINKAAKTQNKAYLTSLIRNNNDVKNSPYINQITNAIANGFNKYKPEEIDFSKMTDEVRDKFIKYVAPEADEDSVILNKNNGQIKYKVDGEWTEPVDIKDATLKIQSAEALEIAEANIPQITEIFNKLYNSPSNISKNIAEFIGKGSLQGLASKEIFSNIFNIKEKDFKLDLKSYGLNEELLNQLGYTAKELLKSLQQNVINYKIAERNIKENLITQKSKTSYDFLSEQRKSLNLKEQESLVNILNKTSAYGGKEATTNTGLLFKNFSGEQLKTFLNNISTFDWNSIDVKTFKENLAELGIEVQLEDKIIQSFISSMRLTTSQTIKTIQENYATKKKIIDSLDIFSSISAEDFEKLGKDFKEFFIQLDDGSYALIKSGEELKGKLEQLQRVSLQSFYDEKSKEYEILSKASNGNSEASTQDDAKAKLDIILSFANSDKEIENKVAEFREKLENNTGLDEITNYFNDFVGKLDISEGLEKQREELRSTAISLILLSENTEEAIKQFSEAEWISNDDIAYIRKYILLQGESSDRVQEIVKYSEQLAKIFENDVTKTGYKSFEELAKHILDSNDAITAIKDNFSSWETILSNSSIASPEYISTLEEVQEAVSTLFGIKKENITVDFLEQNKEALKQLSEGATSVKLSDGSTITDKQYLNLVAYNEELDKYANYLVSIGTTSDYNVAFNIAKQVNESNDALKNLTDNFESWNKILTDSTKQGTQEYQKSLDGIKTALKTLTGKDFTNDQIIENLSEITKLVNGDFTVAINGVTIKWQNLLNKIEKAEELTPPILKATQEYLAEADALEKLNKQYEELNRQKSNATEQDQIEILKQQNKLLDEQIAIYNDLDKKYSTDLQTTRDSISTSEFGKNITFNKDGSVDLASYSKYITDEQNRIDQITNKEDNEAAQKKLDNFKAIIQTYLDLWSAFTENAEAKGEAEWDKFQNYAESVEINASIKLNIKNAKEEIEKAIQEEYDKTQDKTDEKIKEKEETYNNLTGTKSKLANIEERKKLEEQKKAEAKNEKARQEQNLKLKKDSFMAATGWSSSGDKVLDMTTLESKLESGLITKEQYDKQLSLLNEIYTTNDEIVSLNKEIDASNKNIEELDEESLEVQKEDRVQKFKQAAQAGEQFKSYDFNQFKAEGSKNYQLAQIQGIIGNATSITGDVGAKISELDWKQQEGELDEDYKKRFKNQISQVSDIIANGIKGMMEDAQEKYMAKIDQVLENWDKLGEKFETILSSLDHYANVAELLYGPNSDKTKELKKSANEAKINTSLGNMERQKVEKQKLTEQLSNMKEGDEDYEKVKAQLDELNAEMEQSVESHLQLVKEQYALAVEEIMDNFEKEMTGGDSLSKISERWQDSQELAKGYYDEVEKIYQLESLQNTLEKDIAGAGSVKDQQKITEFMNEQMKILKSKNKLSEQDMLIAQKKYDILKAEMDLEDARNNKNTMKLTRGSDGNWSYQYVANTDDVLEKQQQVRDANNELYASMKSNFTSLTSDILSTAQTANQRITEIVSEMDTADSTRYAELEAEKQRLTELYYGSGGILSQKYAEYLQARDELTQMSGQSMLDFENETVTEMANKWKDDPDSLKNSALNAYTSMSQAQANVAKEIEKATAAIGENFTNVENSIKGSTEAARLLGEQVSELGEQTEGIYEMKKAVDILKATWFAVTAAQVVSHFLSLDWVGGAAGAAALAAIIAGDVLGGIGKFDTGGYTGDWGKDGKMAVLHEKELVLNKDDTANMLEAVSAVRDISSIGDSVASNVENGVSNLVSNSLDLPSSDLSGNIDNSDSSTNNNTFEITMNVNGGDVEEIKEAIFSLPTLASQYLSKNQK